MTDYKNSRELRLTGDDAWRGRLWWPMTEPDMCPETGGWEGGDRETGEVCAVVRWEDEDGRPVEDAETVATVYDARDRRAVCALPDLIEANADAWCALDDVLRLLEHPQGRNRDALCQAAREASAAIKTAMDRLDAAHRLAGWTDEPDTARGADAE